MGIHDQTAAAIAANRPGYAQMTRGDCEDIVSWHDQGFSETSLSGWDRHDARCALIDAWARGQARVTPGTFSEIQILHRAEQWLRGSGRHIARGHADPELAGRIRRLVEPEPEPRPEATRSGWVAVGFRRRLEAPERLGLSGCARRRGRCPRSSP